jgi:hypothetical protein
MPCIMDDPFPLVADVLRRKLPEAEIAVGEHKLAGTALVDLDVQVNKGEDVLQSPNLPWKQIVAALAWGLGDTAPNVIGKAAERALNAEKEITLPAAVEQRLEAVRSKQKRTRRAGPTKVTGEVAIAGFAPSTLILPHWAEIRRVIAEQRRAA